MGFGMHRGSRNPGNKIRAPAFFVFLFIFAFCAGCLTPSARPPIDWPAEIARWDAALGVYAREILPAYTPDPALMAVYRRRAEIPELPYAAVLRRGNAVADMDSGTMHLPVWRARDAPDAPRSPWRMLRHELGHLHLHRATAFRLPPDLSDRFGTERLPAAPWWLHEGWAAHVEDAAIENDRLTPPAHNVERSLDLQLLIRTRRCPDPWALLVKTGAQAGGTADYAAAWGLVHWILRHPDPALRERHRDGWRRYLDACRRGFYAEDDEAAAVRFATEFLDADGRPVENWKARWARRVAREGAAEFKRIFVAPRTDAEWAAAWKAMHVSDDLDRGAEP